MLFVAKPFLGFSMFTSSTPPAAENIYVKAFTKRKQEFSDDSNFDIITVQKKLAEPIVKILLPFSFLLSILFPVVFKARFNATNRFLNDLKLSLSPPEHAYLVNRMLLLWYFSINRNAAY